MLWPRHTERWPDRVPTGMNPAFPAHMFGAGRLPHAAITSSTQQSISGEIARKCLTVRENDGMDGT